MASTGVHATLVCVRRGPLEARWDQAALGQTDPPLAPGTGPRELAVIHRLAAFSPIRVLTSDLVRARSTAALLAEECAADLTVDPALRERSLGRWDGETWSELIAREETEAVAFLNDFADAAPPEGEHLTTVQERVRGAVLDACRRHPRQHLCYVGHVGPIRSLIADAVDLSLAQAQRLQIDPFGACVIRYQGPTATLALLNHPMGGEHPADVSW